AARACCGRHSLRSYVFALSLHDALPILLLRGGHAAGLPAGTGRFAGEGLSGGGAGDSDRLGSRQDHGVEEEVDRAAGGHGRAGRDRKSTRLNSSHVASSYAVFCLKKKTI